MTGSPEGDEALARKDPKAYIALSEKNAVIHKNLMEGSEKLLKAKGDRLLKYGSPIEKLTKESYSSNITSTFDTRSFKDIGFHAHKGIDVKADEGTQILATYEGKIEFKKASERTSKGQALKDKNGDPLLTGYGYHAVITHPDGSTSLYGHMNKKDWEAAQEQYTKKDESGNLLNSVNKGDKIGGVGSSGYSTGNHLHFEIRINDSPVDPIKVFKKTL